ncbi:uncharacterized protein [Henckelia pumila]|uniref:uncharacterized protein n=1 Tax=Henckelia pumila TaxID=405737 RepID=UPI003C6E0062
MAENANLILRQLGEDPHKHLMEFHVVCTSMKPHGVTEEHIQLRAFPFLLKNVAKDWLYYLPPGSITTWAEINRIFLEKCFPASRTDYARCGQWRSFVDKTPIQARNLIENMAANSQQFGTNRSDPAPRRGNEVCEICTARGHAIDMCLTLQEKTSEQVNAAEGLPGAPQRNYYSYSNTFNPGWKDHPNLRYGNPPANQSGPQTQSNNQPYGHCILHNSSILKFQCLETRASIQHLNTQVGQLAIAINRLEAQNSSSLPSQTVVNPKENVSAITFRSGRELKVHEEVVKEPVQNEYEEKFKVEQTELNHKEAPRGDIQLETTMLDLGALINVMPYSVYFSINVGPLNETTIIIQMADRSTIYPRGVLEDVLVQVDNLVFPANFYVLDMKNNDLKSPILLGKPFLKTSKSIIDVNNGTLTMEFDGEIVKFNIFDNLNFPSCESVVNNLDIHDHLSQEHTKDMNEGT